MHLCKLIVASFGVKFKSEINRVIVHLNIRNVYVGYSWQSFRDMVSFLQGTFYCYLMTTY